MLFTSSAKVGEDCWCDDVCECVQRCSLSRVIKFHVTTVHVQNHSDHFWLLSHVERLPWRRTGFMLSITISYCPESLRWCQHMFPFPVDGIAGYPYHPISIVADLHIPAMESRGITLSSKHLSTNIKALRVVWQLEDLSSVLHNCEILREDEAAGCCIGIQNHWSLKEKEGRGY